MNKQCWVCDGPFKDQDEIVAVVRTRFKMIPSRVHFAIESPTDIYELQHIECAVGDLIPPEDDLED